MNEPDYCNLKSLEIYIKPNQPLRWAVIYEEIRQVPKSYVEGQQEKVAPLEGNTFPCG